MAIVIFFSKAAEDPVRVVYLFGPSRKSLRRRLVIDKATGQAVPVDGEVDVMFEGATTKILRLAMAGRWPERGVHALR